MIFLAYSTAICESMLVTAELKRGSASYAANLIVHPTNARLAEDVDLVVKHKSPLVIASVGIRRASSMRYGAMAGVVFSDVASSNMPDARQKPEWMV
jgi:nitronate monooxygenase